MKKKLGFFILDKIREFFVFRFTIYSSGVQFILPLVIISVVYINIYLYLKVKSKHYWYDLFTYYTFC